MPYQRGFAPIVFILIILVVSAGIVSGTLYLKNKSNQIEQNKISNSGLNNSINPVTNSNTSSLPALNNSANNVDSIVHPSSQRQSMILGWTQNLKVFKVALNTYYSVNGAYPSSGLDARGMPLARSNCQQWGGYSQDKVILDLSGKNLPPIIPSFMPAYPTDPSTDNNKDSVCYVYMSNGTDYKVKGVISNLDLTAQEFQLLSPYVDPKFNGQSTPCNDTPTAPSGLSVQTTDAQCW